MKNFLIILLLLIFGCSNIEDYQFTYKEKIIVESGFYEGYTGTVEKECRDGSYWVKLNGVDIMPILSSEKIKSLGEK